MVPSPGDLYCRKSVELGKLAYFDVYLKIRKKCVCVCIGLMYTNPNASRCFVI